MTITRNILITFAVYVFSYWLWRALILSPITAIDDLGSLIFLPHGIRLLSVILFGWVGVIGSLLGAVFSPYIVLMNAEPLSIYDFGETCAGALAPILSIFILRWVGLWNHAFNSKQIFKALSLKLLMLVIFLSSFLNAFSSNLITAANAEVEFRSPVAIINFLIGDIVGALIVITLAISVSIGFNRYKKVLSSSNKT